MCELFVRESISNLKFGDIDMRHYVVVTVSDEEYLVIAESVDSAINDYDYGSELELVRLATRKDIVRLSKYPHDIFYYRDDLID